MQAVVRCLAAALFVSALACAHAQDRPLTGEEIRQAWVGKKVFARSATGGLMDFHMQADNTAQVSVGNLNDTGTWRTTDKGYCASWKTIRAGQERCFSVVMRGSTLYVLNPDNSINAEVLRVIGN